MRRRTTPRPARRLARRAGAVPAGRPRARGRPRLRRRTGVVQPGGARRAPRRSTSTTASCGSSCSVRTPGTARTSRTAARTPSSSSGWTSTPAAPRPWRCPGTRGSTSPATGSAGSTQPCPSAGPELVADVVESLVGITPAVRLHHRLRRVRQAMVDSIGPVPVVSALRLRAARRFRPGASGAQPDGRRGGARVRPRPRWRCRAATSTGSPTSTR